MAYKMSLFMITQRVYPSIHQAIYINLSGITSEIECSLLSSSKVSIRMGQLLLFIFTFFTTFIFDDDKREHSISLVIPVVVI